MPPGAPAPDTILTSVRQIAVGSSHSCALLRDGTVLCWGANESGQLGDGTTTDRALPTRVPGLTHVARIALEGGAAPGVTPSGNTCAYLDDRSVRCWGENAFGQLGDGTKTNRSSPTPFIASGRIRDMTVGYAVLCAILVDGSVECAGIDETRDGAQLVELTHPTRVPSLERVASVSHGDGVACALRGDGTVVCWGHMDAVRKTSPLPTPVEGLTGAVELAVGGMAACARLEDGSIRCWGNDSTVTGTEGTPAGHSSPTAVEGLESTLALAMGTGFGCALIAGGSVRCWGGQVHGELGDGLVNRWRVTPAPVIGVSDAVEISAAYEHACARKADDTVTCWGSNARGQLGDGTRTHRATAVSVRPAR